MKIIPVLDLLSGVCVHGVAGERSEYQPLRSTLIEGSDPLRFLEHFAGMGFDEIYIAELDGICGRMRPWDLLREIKTWSQRACGVRLKVDLGIADVDDFEVCARMLGGWPEEWQVVVGTETLLSLNAWEELGRLLDHRGVVVSFDYAHERLMTTKSSAIKTDVDLLDEVVKSGCREVIVLELSDVGGMKGLSTLNRCRLWKQRYPELSIVAGGGISSKEELLGLRNEPLAGVLMATAIHQGLITICKLERDVSGCG